jgi:nucleotide-binding universal stress UspA family protein
LESFEPKRILVPFDGSENSTRAMKVGLSIAKQRGARLTALNAIPAPRFYGESPVATGVSPNYYEVIEEEGKRIIEEAKKFASTSGISVDGVVIRALSSVVQEIVDYAEKENMDLIVIGTRGLGGFKRLMLGSVSTGVVTHAQCNVLVVR